MLKTRIIPCLDVADGRVVKGVNFVDLRDAGDPARQGAFSVAGLTAGAKWVVETEVRLNNVAQNNQLAGLTFYGGPDGARPDITFGLDNWDSAARAVRLQGLGDNVPNAAVMTTASRVILRVEVEEGGATDTYNFFFRETTADAWVPLPGAAPARSVGGAQRMRRRSTWPRCASSTRTRPRASCCSSGPTCRRPTRATSTW